MLKNKTAFKDCLEDTITNQAGDLLTLYCLIQERERKKHFLKASTTFIFQKVNLANFNIF